MSVTIRMDNGDFEIGSGGEQIVIEGAEKGAQDLLEECLLPYEPQRDRGNQMFNADGSLTSITGSTLTGAAAVRTFLQEAVTRLQRAQADDLETDRSEVVQRITQLLVRAQNNDPTAYAFLLSVVIDDSNIGLARSIRLGHLGETPTPLLGGYDP